MTEVILNVDHNERRGGGIHPLAQVGYVLHRYPSSPILVMPKRP